mmetsp:Transcript_17244/g.50641  ORF Transcript_17244/g.50641 Transcript_17244/m.50641 type:complete len:232 (-) Transcript_17244:21-716(-)
MLKSWRPQKARRAGRRRVVSHVGVEGEADGRVGRVGCAGARRLPADRGGPDGAVERAVRARVGAVGLGRVAVPHRLGGRGGVAASDGAREVSHALLGGRRLRDEAEAGRVELAEQPLCSLAAALLTHQLLEADGGRRKAVACPQRERRRAKDALRRRRRGDDSVRLPHRIEVSGRKGGLVGRREARLGHQLGPRRSVDPDVVSLVRRPVPELRVELLEILRRKRRSRGGGG